MPNPKTFLILAFFLLFFNTLKNKAQEKVPEVYSNIHYDAKGNLYLLKDTSKIYAVIPEFSWQLKNIMGNIAGTRLGLYFDFQKKFSGTLYYGFIALDDSKYPQPVFFKKSAQVLDGKAAINLYELTGKYDMINWQETGKGLLGYRLLAHNGQMLYDGIVAFKQENNKIKIAPAIIEGPFINLVSPHGVTISFTTNMAVKAKITVDNQKFKNKKATVRHEIKINDLMPDTEYTYTIDIGHLPHNYTFKTAPKPGSRSTFTFAYCSDSRAGKGGGERNVSGTNFYIMKKIMALSTQNKVAFMQFTGDLINGYANDVEKIQLEYANWKRVTGLFAKYFPVYTGMGNHEALIYTFIDNDNQFFAVNQFPFEKNSSEKIFADNFVNPVNGPESEDGASYDPNKKNQDFPSYKENVFYYTYDNIAMIVLNSNYWYAPSLEFSPLTSGNLHGYIMDNQLKWLEKTLISFENNPDIDHVFITLHTPLFPNGGHVSDDMWYNGDNSQRPFVAGKPLKQGIIQRRDEILNITVNKSKKVIAFLTGDEHNYCVTRINPDMEIYPEKYTEKKIKLSGTIYQVNNGAGGAPYYSQEQTPWSEFVSGFTTQNALVLFDIDGKSVSMRVINPDTLEKIDELILSK